MPNNTPHLTIQAAASVTPGVPNLHPVPAPEQPQPLKPGKKPGDIIVDSGTILVSTGPEGKIENRAVRQAGNAAGQWLVRHEAGEIGLPVTAFDNLPAGALAAFCEGLLLGAFQFDLHKSDIKDTAPVTVHVLAQPEDTATPNMVRKVNATAGGANLAREWSHEPPNVINPVTLAARAQALAAETGLRFTVFGEPELTEMGAGAIISVGLGSKTPSQLIMLEHPGTDPSAPPVVIAGKAITFDTGGYSLKSPQGMLGMKYDKCGGMAVAGIMQAVAALDLPVRVVGLIAAAENMVSAEAYRPNDIITSLSGKTIEIISTDAEGRMVLADALTYASNDLNPRPRALIDLATLTGGVVTALGKVRAGLMATDDALADALYDAGERTDERLWRFPLDAEYFELIKGSDSDLRNSAGKPFASSIVGGTFLKQFVLNDVPWAHLDIAGMAATDKGPGQLATGFGVRLILNYLENLG